MNENNWLILAADVLGREATRHEHSLAQAQRRGAPYEEICNLKSKIYLKSKASEELRRIYHEKEGRHES